MTVENKKDKIFQQIEELNSKLGEDGSTVAHRIIYGEARGSLYWKRNNINEQINHLKQRLKRLQSFKNYGLNRSGKNSNDSIFAGWTFLWIFLIVLGPLVIAGVASFSLSIADAETIAIASLPLLGLLMYIHMLFYRKKNIEKVNQKLSQLSSQKESTEIEIKKLLDTKSDLNDKLKDLENKRVTDLKISQKKIIEKIDKNNNGVVDGLEHKGFDLYLTRNEEKISKIKKEHIKDFVMISNHLDEYKKNIQSIFNLVTETKNEKDLQHYVDVIQKNIHGWQLLQANGIYMIDSLIDERNIQFFRLYQSFEKLGVFDTTWQKNISEQLILLNSNISGLIDATESMSDGIISAIGDLTHATEKQTEKISGNISSIDSSVKFGNLLSAINIYQNHRIGKKLN
tara:strand:+ start:55 stop:1251 length:1197 start_codon:yes stop_codon:yes gene_type:complete